MVMFKTATVQWRFFYANVFLLLLGLLFGLISGVVHKAKSIIPFDFTIFLRCNVLVLRQCKEKVKKGV